MNLENIGKDCPCYEFDCSDIMFDIGEFCGLPPNNGKLTIQVNGSTVGDFSANQQEDETINITTPTSQDIANAVAGEALLRKQADDILQANIDAEELARQRADRDIQAVLDGESLARVNADRDLQSQIDAIASKSDVVDVVGTYAELQAYDTSKLNDNDVVKVLDDSTHNDTMTYYRWNKTTQTWSYIGQESPYYSKSQMDTLLATKQNNLTAGNGIDITGDTISADTTVLATKSDLESYAEKSNTYTKSEVDNLVEPKLSVEMVESLPAVGEESKLYLTPKAHTTQTATGNPISASITDGAGQIEDFQLDGDTYQQSYSGKNLLKLIPSNTNLNGLTVTVNNSTGVVRVSGTPTQNWSDISSRTATMSLSAGTYTFSISQTSSIYRIVLRVYDSSFQGGYNDYIVDKGGDSVSFTLSSDINNQIVRIYISYNFDLNPVDWSFIPMLEKSATPTTPFEPYVGGIASPNPDYPQPIQVVTGEQTVSINGTDYPISLGSIELCKLGTYQDYIYKDGDDWKVHKATSKYTFNGSEAWVWDNTRIPRLYLSSNALVNLGIRAGIPPNSSALPIGKTNRFVPKTFQAFYADSEGDGFAMSTSGQNFQVGDNSWSSESSAKDDVVGLEWLYTLATGYATDTVITDSTLISQLNAIASASLETGTNTITNSATGSNLAGDMEVDYFGYDPTNRYDKWLWLDINNAYEKLGS